MGEEARRDYEGIVSGLREALDFMGTIGAQQSELKTVDMFMSHEGLHLDFEGCMTRKVGERYVAYCCDVTA